MKYGNCAEKKLITANITFTHNVGSTIYNLYCLDYKETDELTEPGYLCDVIANDWIRCPIISAYVNKYLFTSGNAHLYCCNGKYLPPPTKSPIRTKTFAPTPVSSPHRTEIKTPDPSVIPVTKNNKNNIANLVSFFVLTSLT